MTAKKFLLPLLAGGVALTLAACGGPAPTTTPSETASGDPGSSASATPTESTPAAQAGWDINETPADQLADGGEFIGSIGSPVWTTTWNINTAEGNEADLSGMTAPIRPVYFDYNAAGDPEINTDYLLDYAEDVTDGKLTLTLNLNPAAKWNNGDVIDADDWIATWKALNGSDEDFSVASTEGFDQVESVEAGTSPTQVIIKFAATYPDWTAIIGSGPVPAEGAKDADTWNTGWAEFNNDWFTGPFVVTATDKTSGNVTMERNPNWWGATPKLEKITWKNVPLEAAAAAFANQEIDVLDIGADPDGYVQASSAQNSVVRVAAGPNFRHFTFNGQSPLLQDVNVRQAIVKGIDRTVIAQSDLAGLPGDLVPLQNNVFMADQSGFVDLGAETGIDYDPAGAKAQLEAAGWALNAAGFYEKDGKQLDVNFAVLGGVKASENEYLLASQQLKEIGVNLTQTVVDTQTNWPGVLVNHEFDIVAFSWIGTPYPLRGIDQIYGGTTKDGAFTANDSNFAQLDIPAVNELTPQIAVEMDHEKRVGLAQEAAKAIWESVHTLPLYQRPMLIGVRDKLANYGAFGFGSVKWTDVGFTSIS